jgi:hypothetical protein
MLEWESERRDTRSAELKAFHPKLHFDEAHFGQAPLREELARVVDQDVPPVELKSYGTYRRKFNIHPPAGFDRIDADS